MLRHTDLLTSVREYDPDADVDSIEHAYRFAAEAHGSQRRASGEPYISHPLAVAGILAGKRLDPATIKTALLHDTVEDTQATLGELTDRFGGEVATLVDGVTKLSKLELQPDQSKQAENFRKLVVAMSRDIRVLVVKLADRLHNMRTLGYVRNPEKRARIANETMEIYAPLAERIGMQDWHDELTDLAFAELHSEARRSVLARLDYLRERGHSLVDRVIETLRHDLESEGIKAEVSGREKLPYSIWEKMKRKDVPFEQLTDIMAFRIIVDDVHDCYRALGVIHAKYRAVLGRFKDYISLPKLNGYRSIHTAVIGPENLRVEVQIRTREMHRVAEYGVAAHWNYKSADGAAMADGLVTTDGLQYSWIRGLLEILEQASGADEFLEHTRLEMYKDQVFCFTPGGTLIPLPQGATPVDFAYAVHSDIGDHCVGAKVNGKLVPLRTKLQNGDQVEISTSRGRSPSPEWLQFVVTGKARARVRRAARLRERDQYIALGKEILKSVFATNRADLNDRALAPALDHFGYSTADDFHAALGEGLLGEQAVGQVLFPNSGAADGNVVALAPARRQKARDKEQVNGLNGAIRGLIPGMAMHFARCCHPLPGDAIVGIVTTGKGVTIHTADCASLESFRFTPERWLNVDWDPDAIVGHVARLRLSSAHQPGQLAQITASIAANRGNITNLRFTNRAEDFFDILIDIEVTDVSHLGNIIAALRALPTIASVERARG
ncbi:MAG: bifunctional (p)ppGpp synthetase/guanosine-3',5'-bis(diphosphate) 3'-pyrophosphohydrolase [Alphaproteobacteria bacterium]|nr:bifunctional (p)ppGpp synthetase/guanosine-3',5'-bis(diphosphate) 3'-pyrophosphohydrolase [Alphaproteobacteria bacterium]MCB9931693.1 bifunctional (p)ppGpp synthetase/guanosine-3',5'-bis(diphosphate) 3'-pyrophosphohydrolase [Alphaproteobacteria bacterium]